MLRPAIQPVFQLADVRRHGVVHLLGALAQRSMRLQATLQEGVLMLGDGTRSVDIEPLRWK